MSPWQRWNNETVHVSFESVRLFCRAKNGHHYFDTGWVLLGARWHLPRFGELSLASCMEPRCYCVSITCRVHTLGCISPSQLERFAFSSVAVLPLTVACYPHARCSLAVQIVHTGAGSQHSSRQHRNVTLPACFLHSFVCHYSIK